MEHSSTTLVSALALAIVTACGGGGQEPTGTQADSAGIQSPTAERVVTIVGRERTTTATAFPAINTSAAADPVRYVDPLIVHRVQAELDKIESALRQLDDSKVEKHEALEVVSDARAELRRHPPNKLRLRSLLSGLVQGSQRLNVQGAGDLLPGLALLV